MWLEEYYNKIQSGEIIAGIEIKIALNRLMQDLKNPKYAYKTKDADKRIYFIGACLQFQSQYNNRKHTITQADMVLE